MLEPEDVYRMRVPTPRMDGTKTLEMYDRARELLYDTGVGVRMEWRHRHLVTPNFGVWINRFMGQERFMYWLKDAPWAVRLFFDTLSETFIEHAKDMERRHRLTDNHSEAGDLFPWHGAVGFEPNLCNLWVHSDAQEFTLISPDDMDQFLMPSQRFIFGMFGLGSFGCCESSNNKLHIVKTLPNLRRVTLSERTNWEYAIKELGDGYVYVVRPSLVDTFYVQDETAQRKAMRKMVDTFKGLHWECNCPGPDEFAGDPERFHKWVKVARDELGR